MLCPDQWMDDIAKICMQVVLKAKRCPVLLSVSALILLLGLSSPEQAGNGMVVTPLGWGLPFMVV